MHKRKSGRGHPSIRKLPFPKRAWLFVPEPGCRATVNIPIPFTFNGTAVKVKPMSSNRSRLKRCYTSGFSAPNGRWARDTPPSPVLSNLRIDGDEHGVFLAQINFSITA